MAFSPRVGGEPIDDSLLLVAPAGVVYYRAAFAAVVAVQLATIWLPSWNALTDFPTHLVRAYVLANYSSSPFLQAVFGKLLVPNGDSASNYLATPLVPWIGMIAAGKVFLSALVLIFDAGCHLLGRAAHGAATWASLGCGLLAFHGVYQYGFVAYCFAVSLLLVTLALWYRWRDSWTPLTLLCLAALITALFFAHLAGITLAFVAIASAWLGDTLSARRLGRRILVEAAAFLPSVALWLALPRQHRVAMDFRLIEWSTLQEKLADSFTLFRSGNPVIDGLVLLLLLSWGLLGLRSWRQHNPVILRAGLLLVALFLVLPRVFLLRGGSGVDLRFIIPGLLLCLLSFRLPRSGASAILGLAILGVLGARLIYQFETLSEASRVTEDAVRMVDRVPRSTEFWMLCENRLILRRNLHAGDYGVARLGAIPSNFLADPTYHPIWFRRPIATAPELLDRITAETAKATMPRFRYAVVCGFESTRGPALEPWASEVAASGPCSLWQSR